MSGRCVRPPWPPRSPRPMEDSRTVTLDRREARRREAVMSPSPLEMIAMPISFETSPSRPEWRVFAGISFACPHISEGTSLGCAVVLAVIRRIRFWGASQSRSAVLSRSASLARLLMSPSSMVGNLKLVRDKDGFLVSIEGCRAKWATFSGEDLNRFATPAA